MKVLVCGSRDWHRDDIVRERLARLPRGTTIIHGGCRGADNIAGRTAHSLGFHVIEYPADWAEYGRSAGIRRNIAMLAQNPDLVLAFHLNGSTGTQHVIDEALKRGIDLEVFAG